MNNKPLIYAGSDSTFFKMFGISFVKSFKHFNPEMDILYHIMDPKEEDLELLELLPCEYTVSYTDQNYINEIIEKYKDVKWLLDCSDKNLAIKATWYRCWRFIEISRIWNSNQLLMIYDVDTVAINKMFDYTNEICNDTDQGCLDVKGNQVVSLTAFRNNSRLLKEWGELLEHNINEKIFHPTMDQNIFINCATKYDVQKINLSYCNYSKKNYGFALTGKGIKKIENARFIEHVEKWR